MIEEININGFLCKVSKPEQFPKDEILNDKERLARAWMSVEVKDTQGETVPIDQLKKVMGIWFKRGAPMMDQHSNRHIGKGLKWEIKEHKETKTPGIMLDYMVFDDYTIDNQVWKEIKSGDRSGLSIGGRSLGTPKYKIDDYSGEATKYLDGSLELYEVSPVDKPACPFGKNVAVNYLAKSGDETEEDFAKNLRDDLQKGYNVKSNEQHFGGFKDFEEAVQAQKERGHTDSSAKRVATWLMHTTNDDFMRTPEKDKKPEGQKKKCRDRKKFNDYKKEKNMAEPKPDGTGPHGRGKGPGQGKGDGTGLKKIIQPLLEDAANPKELIIGIDTEMEHTVDQDEAKMIALQHLAEDPKYYTKLKEIEKMDYSKSIIKELNKKRVYLTSGQKAPEGANVQQGPQGGSYYESSGSSDSSGTSTPSGAEGKPEESKPADDEKPTKNKNKSIMKAFNQPVKKQLDQNKSIIKALTTPIDKNFK